jgi:hypothetical protein
MRRVVVLAEAAEDLEAARAFYNAQEARVGEHCVNSLLTDIEAWRSAMESIASSMAVSGCWPIGSPSASTTWMLSTRPA